MFVERHIRNLRHQKSARTVLGEGVPSNTIGHDGEFRLHSTGTGVKLYAKYNGKWYGFSPDTTTDTEIFTQDSDKSISEDGSITFPGGFMMQWGKETVSATTTVVVFPAAFPKACRGAFITLEDAGAGGEAESPGLVNGSSITTTGFTANTLAAWDSIYWLAIGN